MSTSTEQAFAPALMADRSAPAPAHAPRPATDAANDRVAVDADRRNEARHTAIYRPCCIIRGKRATMGLLRNFSTSGACIESDLEFAVNDRITYFWESKLNIVARVAWREGRLYGLEHVNEVREEDVNFPARSVRVPCKAEATCWIGGERHTAQVENISLGGMRLRGLPEMRFGSLMTVCFCGLEVEGATARWSDGGSVGLRFKQRLTRQQLAELLLNRKFGFDTIEFEG